MSIFKTYRAPASKLALALKLPYGLNGCQQAARTLLAAILGMLMMTVGGGALAHNLITKTTSTPTVNPGGTVSYIIKVDANGTSSPVNEILVKDLLPAGFSYKSTTAVRLLNTNSTRTGILNPTPGTTTPIWGTFSNVADPGTAPDGAFEIEFVADVSPAIACGVYVNTASKVINNTAFDHTNTDAASTAPISILPPSLVVDKTSVAPRNVAPGGTATYTLTVTNNAPIGNCAAVGVLLKDTLPAGFLYGATDAVVVSSGATRTGVLNPTVGSTAPAWGTFTIPAQGSVQITFRASVGAAVVPGIYSNSAAVTTTSFGTAITNFNGATSTADDINVPPPPVLSKAFSASSIGIGQTTTLVFTIDNSAANAADRTLIAFKDTLRSGLSIVNPAAPTSTSCGAPLFTAANATQPFTATAISVAAGASCEVVLTVVGSAVGTVVNAAADMSALVNLTNGVTSKSVSVVQASVAKSFGGSSIVDGAATTLVFTLTNGAGNPSQGGIALGDTLPTGLLLNSAAPVVTYSPGCSGPNTAIYASASRVLSGLSGIAIASGIASCTVTVAGLTNKAGVTGVCPTAALTNLAASITATNASTAGATNQCLAVSVPGVPVSGTVFSDANHNANFDGGESGTGVSSLFVKLVPAVGVVCTGPATSTASVDLLTGAYALANVVAGSYCLVLSSNSIPTDIAPAIIPGWVGTLAPTGIIQLAVLGIPREQQNFGLFAGSRLTGSVFADTGAGSGIPNNGVRDGTEPGLANIVVTARAGTGLIDTVATLSDGSFTLWIPPSASGLIAVAPALGNFLATGGSAGTSGGSYTRPAVSFTAVAGQSSTGVAFGLVPLNALSPNGAQSALAGSSVFYAHVFSPGSGGQVTFSLGSTATPAAPAWSQVAYIDSNCNGVLEATEAPVTGAVTAVAGQPVCVVVKQFVPPGSAAGAQNLATLTAGFVYSGAAPSLNAVLAANDVTTVGQSGAVVLQKAVAKCPAALPLPPLRCAAGGNSVNAAPNDVLEYELNAVNNGTQAVGTLAINDLTPAFTTFVSASCPVTLPAGVTACSVTTQPVVGGQGALQWSLAGSLAPAVPLAVTYRVKIDQ
jgi:uncharacterized repeat protein (TIGR01451 family)